MDGKPELITLNIDHATRVVAIRLAASTGQWGQREVTLLAREVRQVRAEWEAKGYAVRYDDEC